MTSAIPTIDLRPLAEGEAGLARVAAEVGRACRGIGFFAVSHPPMPDGLRDAAFAAAEAFFALPPERKAAVSIRRSGHNRGYVGLAVEALDPARGPDHKEAFNIGLDLAADDPEVLADRPFRGPNLWPDLPGFRPTLVAYYDAMLALGIALHRAVAVDLGLDPAFFDDKFRRPLATLRLLHYPAAAEDGAAALGAGTHTDYGNLTLLATDGVGGLDVRARDGGWIAVPPMPDGLVCNVGDCLMRWTDGVYASTPHRVVSPAGRQRRSIAFFLDADPDVLVEALPGCVAPGASPIYTPVTVAEYLRARFDSTYGP